MASNVENIAFDDVIVAFVIVLVTVYLWYTCELQNKIYILMQYVFVSHTKVVSNPITLSITMTIRVDLKFL